MFVPPLITRLKPRRVRNIALLATFAFLLALTVSCGSGGDDTAGTSGASPTPTRPYLHPPFEGTESTFTPPERVNFRELADWRLPEPSELPAPPSDANGLEYQPADPPAQCPEGWTEYVRAKEGFRICYPNDWAIDGEGYVTVLNQDRWYTTGIFRFVDGVQAAHVSISAMTPYDQLFTYTKDCDQAYAVTFAGQPAVLCPDAPGNLPEARIIAYHVRTDQFDYFVNVVPYYSYNAQTGTYSTSVNSQLEETAIEIAKTFALTTPVVP